MENEHLEAALAKFNAYIKGKNMRQTPERLAILAKVLEMKPHFDVDELFEAMDKEYHVSKATLYNNIELLCKCDILRKHFLSESSGVYELVEENHLHLVCTDCGKVRIIKDRELTTRFSLMKFRGFSPSSYSINLYGVCSKCRKKAKAEKSLKNK